MKINSRFNGVSRDWPPAPLPAARWPRKVPFRMACSHLDHVFLIMMENHAYGQVIGNPNMPFFNRFANSANLATNYFAVGHPSLTNYLEIVGGSNFGVRDDNSPNWHSMSCATNLSNGSVSLESVSTPICPIEGIGTDAATPALDCTNEPSPPGNPATGAGCDINVDGKVSFAAVSNTTGKTIADQLVEYGLSWKAYEESLPPSGADGVNTADGLFSNLNLIANPPVPPATASTTSNFTIPVLGGDETGTVNGTVQGLYAVKHNPFAYFASVEAGTDSRNSLKNMVGFGGRGGLYEDLAKGELPSLVYIVPNQVFLSRPARSKRRDRRSRMRLRPQRQWHARRVEPGADVRGRSSARTAWSRRSRVRPRGSAATTPWSSSGTRTTTASSRPATRSLLVDTNDQDGYG